MHPFDLHCKNHPEREIDDRARPDRLCTECYLAACNAGARKADAQWHETRIDPSAEVSVDGRNIRDSMRADNKSKYGATFK